MSTENTNPKSNVEIQRQYRMNMAGKGLTRMNMVVKDDVKIALDMMAEHFGYTKRQMLERIIMEKHDSLKNELYPG